MGSKWVTFFLIEKVQTQTSPYKSDPQSMFLLLINGLEIAKDLK